jgi:hypothetical protein
MSNNPLHSILSIYYTFAGNKWEGKVVNNGLFKFKLRPA